MSRVKLKTGDMVAFVDTDTDCNEVLDFGIILGFADETDHLGKKLYKVRWFNYISHDGNAWSTESIKETKSYREYFLRWSKQNE